MNEQNKIATGDILFLSLCTVAITYCTASLTVNALEKIKESPTAELKRKTKEGESK